MVARTPPKLQRKMMIMAPPLNPILLRETVKKVDKCMARLQELQYTVTGGAKVISGVNLSPNSIRSYLRTSLRCKQESLRMKNANNSRTGKLPTNLPPEEWRRMSLPAMLLGETIGEILQQSQFARTIVQKVSSNTQKSTTIDDPKTPLTQRKNQNQNQNLKNSELVVRRKREKQERETSIITPSLQRAKSRINFKVSSSPIQCDDKENCKYIANRVSPRNRPWARKTVLFPNPLFHSSSPTSKNQNFPKTKSPMLSRNKQTPHKFLIKSPPPTASKFQVRIKSPPICVSPPTRKSISSTPNKISTAAKLRRSFSPSRIANRLVSPLKSRKSSVQKNINEGGMKIMMSGLKQRPSSSSTIRFSPRRI
ncbi:hypothetical protein ACJIZ3_001367 [Penstemon smallii]|uniref:Microtubule-binding protein TANGLED n=1 Tax=Penstemon smallii TaxID=265156 RepID=A0ABD3U3E1_9LAMI